ncbi:unnamed protein product (macronuclear) [Paramecium tetraurelia]|uniref:PHD-type domain-containing protein n=1 Tax=Paramecium tetraurelia TaxID=5888 RepID=A0DES3_PARTE|nr:uncharacterized protein GSPATT00016366001 [Paramecium tetraurelia]CAK81540.1 unnamed protein product [Paramecium tetraurelia]|eukprot:XP_001448937.1 hypothetical protein (macronuclear) [Paramecium tetraurelia strain d4-2]
MSCSVCGLNFLRKDKGCQQKECQKCKLKYHRFCYGYNNLDEECDPCQDNVQKPVCYICGQDGLLRRVSGYNGMYVHVLCAIFDPCIQVRDYHTMSFGLQEQKDKKTKEKCLNCDKPGASIKCLDCDGFAHPHCIMKERVQKELELIENEQWILNLRFHGNNQDPNSIEVDQQEIKNELDDIQEAFSISIDNIFDVQQKNDKSTSQLKNEVLINLESIFQNYSIPKKKEQFWSDNDKIEGYCQSHMESHVIFCICRKSLNNQQMVQCDHCYEWFHFVCIKKKQIKQDSYVCESCKRWSSRRYKIDLDDPILLSLEDLVIPKEILKIHLLDVLPLLLYMEAIMRKLPRLPLTQDDYQNLKHLKSFLASMPIKPSAEIQLDKILLKQKLLEELKQQMLSILPIQLENNASFFDELTIQLKNKGYSFDKEERKAIKSYILSRKQMKLKIEKGIGDGFLIETTLNLLNECVIDPHKLFVHPNETLLQLINRYIVSSNIKKEFKKLFEGAKFQWDVPFIESQLELTVYKQYILMKNQKSKPLVEKLFELKKMANKSNITMGCVKLIEKLISESITLEDVNIQNNFQQIIEFPFNSDKLLNQIQSHFEAQLIQEFRTDLESKIDRNCRLTERESQGLYSFENIQRAAQESPVIKRVFDQLVEIHNKCQSQEKITSQFCQDIIALMDKCLLTSEYLENYKKKLKQFKELDHKLKEILTLKELEDIEKLCNSNGFELDISTRKTELMQAIEIVESKPRILDNLDQYRYLKSGDLEQYIKQSQQQVEFIRQLFYVAYKRQDNIQVMLQRVKEIRDLDFNNELIAQVKIPEVVFDEISQIVLSFRQIQWRYECQKLLNESKNVEAQNGKKKYNIVQVLKLLNSDNQIQDHYYLMLMQKIKSKYEVWLQSLREFEIKLEGSKAPEQYIFIQIINNNCYYEPNVQSRLWTFYIQMLWMQKAEEFLDQNANVLSIRTLINSAQIANIKPNNQLLVKLRENIKIYDDLNQKIKDYQEQRLIWLRNKDQINNLQTYQQYFTFLENKPDAEIMSELQNQVKQFQGLKFKDLGDDLQEVKQVLSQYNELVQKQPDNNLYIQQLLKIRTCYCHCYLKIQGFSLQLMYNLIKQQSLRCLKQRSSNDQMQERLNEVELLVTFGGEEWQQKLGQINKQRQKNTNSADLKFIDYSLRDDFEWIGWMKENMQNVNQCLDQETQNKKHLKEEKIQNKKEQSTKVEDVWGDLRKASKERFTRLLGRFKNWRQVNEQSILNLESQIFLEMNLNKEKYLKEIQNVQEIIKLNKQKNLTYEEIKKVKDRSTNKQSQSYQQAIIEKKKKQQQQAIKIVEVAPQQIPSILYEKSLYHNESEKQKKKQGQSLLQCPEAQAQIEISKIKEKKQLIHIGELNLLLKKRPDEIRESWLIRPQLLTYDHQYAQFLPRPELITLTQQLLTILLKTRWVYSKNIAVAGDLFNLADKLKNSKQCLGTKQGNVGLTLIYYNFLKKLKPATKWILMRDQFENQQIMNNLQNYHTLKKFQDRLCFIYYIKECKAPFNTIISQPVDYIDVMEDPKLRNIIENYRALKKMQKAQNQKTDSVQNQLLEPINQEENKDDNVQQNSDAQTMLKEIPGILSLQN